MWFITVVEKLDPDGMMDGLCNTGSCRTWGFYSNVEDAIDVLHNNEGTMIGVATSRLTSLDASVACAALPLDKRALIGEGYV